MALENTLKYLIVVLFSWLLYNTVEIILLCLLSACNWTGLVLQQPSPLFLLLFVFKVNVYM